MTLHFRTFFLQKKWFYYLFFKHNYIISHKKLVIKKK